MAEKGFIGIGLTTRNRNETARRTLNQILKYSPTVYKIVVVDDASDTPFNGSTCRFNERAGIARSKNKCLSFLDDCDHIFLFDDDFAPVIDKWWLPYINSGLNHACANYNKPLQAKHDDYWEYSAPNGCMIYLRKCVLDVVGGIDVAFTGYGYDHPNWSDRIFNADLTPARYIDIPNSAGLFQMADVPSSFSDIEKIETIPDNAIRYNEQYYSKEFKPYK